MNPCTCTATHDGRRVVLTGGPGAGKSAVLELARLFFCHHVRRLPEAAGILFGGHFPRNGRPDIRRASQRAIYHVQVELESTTTVENAAMVICDRGTPDGSAYWVGGGTLWDAVGTSQAAELARYHGVIHLRTPTASAARTVRGERSSRTRTIESMRRWPTPASSATSGPRWASSTGAASGRSMRSAGTAIGSRTAAAGFAAGSAPQASPTSTTMRASSSRARWC